MTSLNFSKTRIVYWEGVENKIVAPKDWNSISDGVTVVSRLENQIICSIDKDKHNWHMVPMNYYGLYCTQQEMLMLFNNNASIKPINMNCVIGHCIPLNTTSTGAVTNLSFNNTIYSLIHDLMPNDHVQPRPGIFGTSDKGTVAVESFCDTYDGGLKANGDRLLLPKPDLLFRAPRVKTAAATVPFVATGAVAAAAAAFNQTPFVTGGTTPYQTILTENNIINFYIPELLLNNDNTKALYPGENQDMLNIDIQDEGYATIDTSAIRMNETFADKDDRNWGMNIINAPFDQMTSMNVVPLVRGPTNGEFKVTRTNDVITISTPYDTREVRDVEATNPIRFFREMIRNRHNNSDDADYSSLLPTKFIKCLPIIDNTEARISHTVCATITWNLTVMVTASIMHLPNPYKYRTVYKDRYLTSVGLDNQMHQEVYTQRWPIKHMDENIYKIRSRKYKVHDPAEFSNANGVITMPDLNTFVPYPVRPTGGASSTRRDVLPMAEHMPPSSFVAGNLGNQPTAIWTGTNIPRRSRRLASSSTNMKY
uniref:Uncharacterized protein n=1 Tax=Cecropis daurica parvoviridae sp. TaxID=2794470 RepID=A0A8A4XCW8_9VIRU|nr:MAG: hypothetical protein [Cecropis daurica parvoviridae sp.]